MASSAQKMRECTAGVGSTVPVASAQPSQGGSCFQCAIFRKPEATALRRFPSSSDGIGGEGGNVLRSIFQEVVTGSNGRHEIHESED